jgi:hypothetical protein
MSEQLKQELEYLRYLWRMEDKKVAKLHEIEHAARQIFREDISTSGGMSAFNNLQKKLDALRGDAGNE